MVQWLRIVRIDRILDLRKLLDVGAACEERQPVDQELAICGILFEPERVEPRRRAGAQHVIASADRADEQLAAAVLVEEDDARIELARLREQEIERHGLSRTRRADDREIRSEEHTSELQSLMRISYAVFCLKKKKQIQTTI